MEVGMDEAAPIDPPVAPEEVDMPVPVSADVEAAPDEIAALLVALEGADDLPLDDRLVLLRQAEASIAGVLEGLDGL
jgi:hypothetical protein